MIFLIILFSSSLCLNFFLLVERKINKAMSPKWKKLAILQTAMLEDINNRKND